MKVYSIQETYYQTGNTGMAIHLEGTIEEITELHQAILGLIQKFKMKEVLLGGKQDQTISSEVKAWTKWVNGKRERECPCD